MNINVKSKYYNKICLRVKAWIFNVKYFQVNLFKNIYLLFDCNNYCCSINYIASNNLWKLWNYFGIYNNKCTREITLWGIMETRFFNEFCSNYYDNWT